MLQSVGNDFHLRTVAFVVIVHDACVGEVLVEPGLYAAFRLLWQVFVVIVVCFSIYDFFHQDTFFRVVQVNFRFHISFFLAYLNNI